MFIGFNKSGDVRPGQSMLGNSPTSLSRSNIFWLFESCIIALLIRFLETINKTFVIVRQMAHTHTKIQ